MHERTSRFSYSSKCRTWIPPISETIFSSLHQPGAVMKPQAWQNGIQAAWNRSLISNNMLPTGRERGAIKNTVENHGVRKSVSMREIILRLAWKDACLWLLLGELWILGCFCKWHRVCPCASRLGNRRGGVWRNWVKKVLSWSWFSRVWDAQYRWSRSFVKRILLFFRSIFWRMCFGSYDAKILVLSNAFFLAALL